MAINVSPKSRPSVESVPFFIRFLQKENRLQVVQKKLQEGSIGEAEDELILFLMEFGKSLSLEEMKSIFQIGRKLLLHPEAKQFEIILKDILESLAYFKDLYQEQIDLATISAERALDQANSLPIEQRLEKYTEATHYYAKALAISRIWDEEQTLKLSVESSKIFMRIVRDQVVTRETFKTRLELAQGSGDYVRFQIVLNEITLLKNYRCDRQDHETILSLCEQAKQVLLSLKKSGKETEGLEPFVQQIIHWEQEPYCPKKILPAIKRYQVELEMFRKSFAKKCKSLAPEKVRPFQQDIHQEFLSFFHTLLQDTFAILGPPPCAYDLRACGSLAREEFCPYSDLEWMILIEYEKCASYFKTLADILNLQIISLGETGGTSLPTFSALGSKNTSGFHIDSGGNPATDSNLIGTPKALAQLEKHQDKEHISDNDPRNLFHKLRKTTSLTPKSSSHLFQNYSQQIDSLLSVDNLRQKRAIGVLKYRLRDYTLRYQQDYRSAPLLNIKEHFVELLYHPLSDLALYFGCSETNTLDIIDALPCFTKEIRPLIRESISEIYLIRTRLHLSYEEQKETATQLDQETEGNTHLLQKEKDLLEKTCCLILRPFYSYLKQKLNEENPTINTINLLDLAFADALSGGPFAKKTLYHLGKYLLSQGKKEIQDHLPYYQELSKKNNEPLRAAYLEGIEEETSLHRYLEFLPNQYGKRQIETRKRTSLEQTLAHLTTPNSKEEWNGLSVEIQSPGLQNQKADPYLKKEVLQQILTPNGDIKKEEKYENKTQSNVAHFLASPYNLHFKQEPTDFKNQSPFHPGKEQGVSRLMMRLFGHGVSFSTLTSFTVYRHGKKIKNYLVLISETVAGPTLQDAPSLETLDPKRLTNTFLSIPLLLPGDGREVNTIFHETQNEKGEASQELVSIDNDIVWVKPVIDTNFLPSKTPKLRCQLYTVLFSLFSNFTLHPDAIAQFLLLKPGPLISAWLQEMVQWNQENKMFQPFEKLPAFTYKFQFEKGTGAQILSQFYRLQSFLRAHPCKQNIPAIDLLKAIISFDYTRTTDVGHFIYSEYFKTQNLQGSPSLKTLKDITGRDNHKSISITLSNAATYTYLPRKEEEQDRYLPEEALKEVEEFMVIHFDAFDLQETNGFSSLKLKQGFSRQNPIEKETQEVLLEALIPHSYNDLDLSHCIALTDDHLNRFLDQSGPHLTHLKLKQCPEITDEILPHIATKCPNLKELYLSYCPKLTQIDDGTKNFLGFRSKEKALTFKSLETLHLSHCNALTTFNIDARNLLLLKVDNNPNLRQGNLEAPHAKVEKTYSPQLQLEWGVASLKIQQQQFIEKFSFGAKKWETYFGKVGIQPPLPENIYEIFQSPCTFWPDKKVYETHLLVLIPETVNGKPFHLDALKELIKSPKIGLATNYDWYNNSCVEKELGTKSASSHWALMTRDVIPKSRNKTYDDQKALVAEYAQKSGIPYRLPKALDAATVILMEHVQTETKLYSNMPHTYTRCQEKVHENRWPVAIGAFGAGGLSVRNYHDSAYGDSGVGALREVPLGY